jgi:2-phosphoglycolate phosphatase
VNPDRDACALFWSLPYRVFDLDGTLVDTLPDLTDSLNHALADMHLPSVDASLVRASLHGGLEGSVDAAILQLGASTEVRSGLLDAYRRRYEAGVLVRSRVYDGVRDLLQALNDERAQSAVCTNKPESIAIQVLDGLGLLEYFKVVVGGDSCAAKKPDPLPMRYALANLGGSPERALLVGDSHVDSMCARAAGVRLLWYTGGYGLARSADTDSSVRFFDRYSDIARRFSNATNWIIS